MVMPIEHGSEVIYHYTDAAGLFGIISNDELWASAPSSLNDASELSYGFQLLERQWQLERKSPLGPIRAWLDSYLPVMLRTGYAKRPSYFQLVATLIA
jgi:hypothetical protein